MARVSKATREAELHAEFLSEFDAIQGAYREEREQCLSDRRFYLISGAQYEGDLGEQFANRPMFEINRTHLAVLRIFNEYRNNRITVDFTPKDGAENDTMADACDGMYRADEKACTAIEAYDNAFEEGTSGGIGAWRLRTCYEDDEDDENDRQRVSMEPIYDADSCVFWDLDAKRQDKADAKRCYVLSPYTRAAYVEEFDDDPTTWPKAVDQSRFDWATPDVIWVAEVYCVEEVSQMVYWYKPYWSIGGDSLKRFTEDKLQEEGKLEELEATGYRMVKHKRVEVRKIRKYLMSGSKILEDCGYIAGKHIPIVMYYGKRAVIDGVERAMGHVRLAKDAQRLTNMLMSWLAEIASSFDVERPVFAPEQVARHATMWAEQNVKRYPYLLADPLKDKDGNVVAPAAPQAYTKAPNVPPAMAALLQIATEALNDLLGGQQAGEQLQPNLSGKAVELIQQRLDMQAFIYMDNFARAMKRAGEIWLSIKKEVTHEQSRRMKTIAFDGSAGSVVVNQPKVDQKTGERYLENNMASASFDVDVDVGPSSHSRRAGVVRALSGLTSLTQDPELQQALMFATIANIEGEGLDGLHQYARNKSIRLGIVKPTDEEKQELAQEAANQQPDPQAEYLRAESMKSQADMALKLAQTQKTKADTAKVLAEVDSEQQNQVISAINALNSVSQPQQNTNV